MAARIPKTVYTISNNRDAYAGYVRNVASKPKSYIFAFRQRRDASILKPYFSSQFKVDAQGEALFIVKRTASGNAGCPDLEVCNTATMEALARAYLNNTRIIVIENVLESLDKKSVKMVARFEIEDMEIEDGLRAQHLTTILDSTVTLADEE